MFLKAQKDLRELLKNRLNFIGSINATIANDDKLVIIFPTGSDVKVSELIRDYSDKIFKFMSNKFRGKSFELLADTLAVKRDLSDSHLSVYGTVENNAFLNKYKENLPYTIKDSTIVADKEYIGSKLRFMACLPHPQNKQKGNLIKVNEVVRYTKHEQAKTGLHPYNKSVMICISATEISCKKSNQAEPDAFSVAKYLTYQMEKS